MRAWVWVVLAVALVCVWSGTAMAVSGLRVKCDREGAEIFLNGQSHGACPKNLTAPAGAYRVELRGPERSDRSYDYFETRLTLAEGKIELLEARLSPVYPEPFYYEKIKHERSPAHCKDYLKRFPEGEHVAEVKKLQAELLVEQQRLSDPNRPGSAILSVASDPPGARVFLGERELGVTPYTGTGLPAGTFPLRLEREGFLPSTEEVELKGNIVAKKSITMNAGHGGLTILSTPLGATVWLDGVEQKDKTPLTIDQVQAGARKVKLHLDRYYDAELEAKVEVGKTVLVEVSLNGGDLEQCNGKWLPASSCRNCHEK